MPTDAVASSSATALIAQILAQNDVSQDLPGISKAGPAGTPKKADNVGSGSAAPTDSSGAPDAPGAGGSVNSGAVMLAATASLFAMMPPMQSSDDMDAHLASIEEKMKDTNNGIDKGRVSMDTAEKRAALQSKIANLQNAADAAATASSDQSKASTADKVKLAFSYIGAALTIAVGVIAIATGIGAAAGALLIAGGVIMLALAVDQTMQMESAKNGQQGKGWIDMMAGAITKDLYPNDPDKQASEATKWAMGINFALMGVSIICSIAGAAVNPTGVATAAESMTADLFAATSTAKTAVGVAEGVNDAANASADVASQTYSYEADKSTATATTDKAQNKALDAITTTLDAAIDALMEQMKAAGERFNAVINTLVDAGKDRGESLSHVKFRA